MLKLTLVALLSTIGSSLAQDSLGKLDTDTKKIFISDIAIYHQRSFNMLGAKYANGKQPSSLAAVNNDMMNALGEICDGNVRCLGKLEEAREDVDNTFKDGKIAMKYPDGMDATSKAIMRSVYSTVEVLEKDNLADVVAGLKTLGEEVLAMEDKNKFTMRVLAAIEVAKTSSQTWHAAFYDPTHPLNPLINGKIKGSEGADETCITLWLFGRTSIVVIGDIMGVMLWPANFLDCLQVTYNSETGPYWFSSIMSVAPALAYAIYAPVLSSLRAAADDTICIEGYDDEGEDSPAL